MCNAKIILLTLLTPTIAISDGIDPAPDRFSECQVPGGDPHEVHECYFSVGDKVEREMVQAYTNAQETLRTFDLEHSLTEERSTSELLQETQVAFEQYRKLHCQFPEREALGGTGSINVTVACRVELTLYRIGQLTQHANVR